MQISQKYLNDPLGKLGTFSWSIWNFWHITRLSTTNHHKVINTQTGPAFIGPPYIYFILQFNTGVVDST